jgi:hypothetical protein
MTLYDRCPAATGLIIDDSKRCSTNPDGAHRCRRPQDHLQFRETSPSPYPLPATASVADHVCSCSFVWTTGEPLQKQVDRMNAEARPTGRGLAFETSERQIQLPVPHETAADFITSRGPLHIGPAFGITLNGEDGQPLDLGSWTIVSMEARYSRDSGNHYIATLSRRD